MSEATGICIESLQMMFMQRYELGMSHLAISKIHGISRSQCSLLLRGLSRRSLSKPLLIKYEVEL